MTTEVSTDGSTAGPTDGSDGPATPGADASPVDVRDLPDIVLRPALEFAVGIAAAGQKLRPQLAYPSALKPLLKLNRLDRNSLRIARRAVVADDGFRARLSIVATSEHLDEIGLLWITRPDGWVEQIANAHARALETAETENIEARLRRAERRREAAEQAAARASAELLAQREAIAREQQRRELAEERGAAAQKAADHAERVAAKLRSQLEATEAKLESERVRATQAEDTARALTEALRVAEQTRDAVLARRAELAEPLREAPPPAPANASAARALRNAATATRELAAALAAAGDALNGDDVRSESAPTPRSGRERRTQRRAIAIPGGVYGDSVAAGEYLVKVPGARVVVDGYNLAKLAWPGRNLIDQRECLISLLEDFARRTGVDVHAVFDGADVVGASAGRRIVRVQYSPAGVTADDVIREVVASLPVSTPAVVATNDQAIINDVRAAGANTVSSDVMLVLLGFTSPGSRRR